MIWLPEHPLETLLVEVEDGQMERCVCRACLVRFVMFSMCSAVSERHVQDRKPLPKRPASSQSRSPLRPEVVLARNEGQGMWSVTRVPCPGWLEISTFPP